MQIGKKSANLAMKTTLQVFVLLLVAFGFFCSPKGGREASNGQPVTPQKFYSKDHPREWIDYAEDHAPKVEVSYSKLENNLTVYVVLKNSDQTHYIDSLGILDDKDNIVDKIMFGPGKKDGFTGTFTFDVTRDFSKYRAFARCSQHDLWVTPLSEARKIP